ncbi:MULTISPECIES: hypothetical protein [unclassified Pseudomonas]|uniref:hypothetical protein n=1 Tax=unclassified Pseudomonas TaxID=196821 RepID=UPI00113FE552|nr:MULTISPECIES: hypothetical protein [unclassified Pseudomonas]
MKCLGREIGAFLFGADNSVGASDVAIRLVLKVTGQPTYILLTEYISIPAVTATYGFALTATHFFYKRLKKVSKKTLRPERPAPR